MVWLGSDGFILQDTIRPHYLSLHSPLYDLNLSNQKTAGHNEEANKESHLEECALGFLCSTSLAYTLFLVGRLAPIEFTEINSSEKQILLPLLFSILNILNMILGVSGWLAGKLGWNETHIRIAFVVSFLFFGTGLALYLILWIVKLFSK